MKISKKEKYLLLFLGLIIIAFLYFNFAYKALAAKKFLTDDELFTKTNLYTMQMVKISQMGNTELETKKAKEEILPLAEKYFGEVNQEEFIVLLNTLQETSGIKFKTLEFTDSAIAENDKLTATAVEPTAAPQENQPAEGQENVNETTGPENTTSPEGGQPAEAKPNPAQEYFDAQVENIELLVAQATFDGSYNQLVSLLNSMDLNPENIVSSQIEWKKVDQTAPLAQGDVVDNLVTTQKIQNIETDSDIEGTIKLQFYRVGDIDKYKVLPESILAEPNVPKTKQSNPVKSYPWSWEIKTVATGPNVNNAVPTAADYYKDYLVPTKDTPIPIQSITTVPIVPAVIIPPQVQQPTESYSSTTELMRFDNLENMYILSTDSLNIGEIATREAEGTSYKTLGVKYHLDPLSRNPFLLLDVSGKNITIKNKPEKMALKVYSTEMVNHGLGVMVVDADGNDQTIVLTEKIDWTGWKSIETQDLPITGYPLKIKGIVMVNYAAGTKPDSEIWLDNLSVTHLIVK